MISLFPPIYFSLQSFIDISMGLGYLFDTLDCSPIGHSLFAARIAPAVGVGGFFGLVLMSL